MLALLAVACTLTPEGEDDAEQRGYVLGVSDELLAEFYASDPSLEAEVAAAPG